VTAGTAPRRGLVLGAGGVLGFAWAVGALAALEQARGFDARAADVLVGTSAGSVTAALLGAGVAVETMLRHQQGIVVEGDLRIDYDYDSGGALPPPPKPFPGAPGLLARTMLHPRRVPPMAMLSGALPAGRGTLAPVGKMIDAIVPHGEWAPHPATWVVAMDYQSGRRVPFGRQGSPRAALSDAVMASCSIPGWYAPVQIGDRRYVDGGACSATSLDLLAPMGLDEVVVVAPMASFSTDRPTTVAGRLERRFRGLVTKRLEREAEKVRRGGTEVTLLSPGPEDLEAIGANLMDSRRRERVLQTSLRTSAEALRPSAGLARVG
jgi:NTE family protein